MEGRQYNINIKWAENLNLVSSHKTLALEELFLNGNTFGGGGKYAIITLNELLSNNIFYYMPHSGPTLRATRIYLELSSPTDPFG